MAKTRLEVFGVSCCRQLTPLSLIACMSRSRPLGHVGSVLLSIVTQAFLVDLLYAGDPYLSSSDADGGYQWEV
jgi:hypothetical protein